MTAEEFRSIALSLPDAVESSHMNHPDFRAPGGIFATLGYPSDEWGMVNLTPDAQAKFTNSEPDVFVPVKGVWGRKGATQVCLRPARERDVREALRAAWENRAMKKARPRAKPRPTTARALKARSKA